MGYLVDFDFGTAFALSETVAAFEAHSVPIRAWTGLGKIRQSISKNPFRPTAFALVRFLIQPAGGWLSSRCGAVRCFETGNINIVNYDSGLCIHSLFGWCLWFHCRLHVNTLRAVRSVIWNGFVSKLYREVCDSRGESWERVYLVRSDKGPV